MNLYVAWWSRGKRLQCREHVRRHLEIDSQVFRFLFSPDDESVLALVHVAPVLEKHGAHHALEVIAGIFDEGVGIVHIGHGAV